MSDESDRDFVHEGARMLRDFADYTMRNVDALTPDELAKVRHLFDRLYKATRESALETGLVQFMPGSN